jgi:hypothetical protein
LFELYKMTGSTLYEVQRGLGLFLVSEVDYRYVPEVYDRFKLGTATTSATSDFFDAQLSDTSKNRPKNIARAVIGMESKARRP